MLRSDRFWLCIPAFTAHASTLKQNITWFLRTILKIIRLHHSDVRQAVNVWIQEWNHYLRREKEIKLSNKCYIHDATYWFFMYYFSYTKKRSFLLFLSYRVQGSVEDLKHFKKHWKISWNNFWWKTFAYHLLSLKVHTKCMQSATSVQKDHQYVLQQVWAGLGCYSQLFSLFTCVLLKAELILLLNWETRLECLVYLLLHLSN